MNTEPVITGSILERHFQVNPETGQIYRASHSRNGETWILAGYIKPGPYRMGGGYRRINVRLDYYKNKNIPAHHLIWCWVHGEWPTNELDHIDGNRDNNSISNLRLASVGENRTNKKIQSNNSSGFKWVYRDCQNPGKWRAEVNYRDSGGSKRKFRTSGHLTPDAAYEIASSFAKSAHGTFYNSGKR